MLLSKISEKVSGTDRTYIPSDLLVTPDNFIGIEVELEGVSFLDDVWQESAPLAKYWETTEDGSLRNGGIEVRLRGPLFGMDLIEAMKLLDKELGPIDFETSFRTSTHVHYDMGKVRDSDSLLRLITVAGVFEKVLFKYVGGEREDSIYCMPFHTGRGDFRYINRLATDPHSFGHTNKYQAVNTASLFSLGTVEFRHSGALTTYESLLEWVNILGCLVKFAYTSDISSDNISRWCSERSPLGFFEEVFGDFTDVLNYEGIEVDILQGARVMDNMVNFNKLQAAEVYRTMESPSGGLAAKIFEEEFNKKNRKMKKDPFQLAPGNIRVPVPPEIQAIIDDEDENEIRW